MTHPLNIAQKVLSHVIGGKHIQSALDQALVAYQPPERALITDWVYGTVRQYFSLTSLLNAYLPQFSRLPLKIRAILLIALYSLYYQSKAPAYAILNVSVEIVKKEFGQRLANLCNAVLRKILREEANLPRTLDVPSQTAIPMALYSQWLDDYGALATSNILKRSLKRPYRAYRINPIHPQANEVRETFLASPSVISLGSYGVALPPGLKESPFDISRIQRLTAAGIITSQAAGSLYVLDAMNLHNVWKDAPVWDACAGYGGKTTALMEWGIHIKFASDLDFGRLKGLPSQCVRLGIDSPLICNADARKPPLNFWDGHILADVTCSGTGVIGRRPDILLRWDRSRVKTLVYLQKEILLSLSRFLQRDRELCYITCALNRAENELQVSWLLQQRPDLKVVCEWQTPPEHPWMEGMYAARIRKIS